MLLGPIFTADIVTSSRRTRYFLWRIAYGVILLFTLWANYESVTMMRQVNIATAASLAESFFSSFAFMQLLAIVAIGGRWNICWPRICRPPRSCSASWPRGCCRLRRRSWPGCR